MTQLYLIRHGESVASAGNTFYGARDGGLTPRGVSQVERLRDRLLASGEIGAGVLIASTMQRAWQTATLLAPVWRLPILEDDAFHEIRPGEAEGLTRDEVVARFGPIDRYRDPGRAAAPGGEAPVQVTDRIVGALERTIDAYPGKTVVVVCHGGVVAASFLYFFGMDRVACNDGNVLYPRPDFREWLGRPWTPGFAAENASLTHWRIAPPLAGASRPRWQLVTFNDAAHLRNS